MMASELIERLKDIIENIGDREVRLADWSEEYVPPGRITSISFGSGVIILDAGE